MRDALLVLAALALAWPAAASTLDHSKDERVSPPLAPGESFEAVFADVGQTGMHCHHYPWMSGIVEVLRAPKDAAPRTWTVHLTDANDTNNAAAMAFAAELTGSPFVAVHAGDTVRFVNTGRLIHDVGIQRIEAPKATGAPAASVLATMLALAAATVAAALRPAR